MIEKQFERLETPEKDPLDIEVDMMAPVFSQLGALTYASLENKMVRDAFEAKAREVIAQKDARIAELEAMLPKDEEPSSPDQ